MQTRQPRAHDRTSPGARHAALALALVVSACASPNELRGRVSSDTGAPLSDARVRIQATPDAPDQPGFVRSDAAGEFVLPLGAASAAGEVTVTAGKEGFFTAAAVTRTLTAPVPLRLVLRPIPPATPQSDYRFQSGAVGTFPCFQCHLTHLVDWQQSTHASSVLDPLVLEQLGEFLVWRESGGDVGRRFVDTSGTAFTVRDDATTRDECAQCHAPALAQGGEFDFRVAASDPDGPRAVREGVTCDVCHKMRGLAGSDLTVPGLRLADVRLPAPGSELLFGPLDDVSFAPTGAAYAEAMRRSDICAPCHTNARVIGLQDDNGQRIVRRIYGEDTFREWRFATATVNAIASDGDSPASGEGPFTTGANYAGRPLGCQDCHMRDPPPDPRTGERVADYRAPSLDPVRIATHAEAPLRRGDALNAHRFEGASARMLAWALELRGAARREGGELVVDVEVENRHTGHSVPSGLPDRNLVLEVEAIDGQGPLPQTDGQRLPAWAADGTTAGALYARRLADVDGREPVFYAFAVRDATTDTRIRSGQIDRQTFRFAAGTGAISVRVRLIHRRRFPQQTQTSLGTTIGDTLAWEVP